MSFEVVPYTGGYLPPELAGLLEQMPAPPGLGVLPLIPLFALAGGTAVGATITGWLRNDDWSIGEYNTIMVEMNDTIKSWDQLGWRLGCWKTHPQKRKEWEAFWKRFGRHFGEYGLIGECGDFSHTYTCFLPDSAEKPVRNILLPQLRQWGAWLNQTCQAPTAGPLGPVARGDVEAGGEGASGETDWGAVVKWGSIGLITLVGLTAIGTVRGAFK